MTLTAKDKDGTDLPLNDVAITHVHDLPQLYTKPTLQALLNALDVLKITPAVFSDNSNHRDRDNDKNEFPEQQCHAIDPSGVPRYLTSIVSSSLSWLTNDAEREIVWDTASARLSERSGRNAMPSMTRSFKVNDNLSINLYEPSLTEDNLGLKTWLSSLMLARRLLLMRHHVPIARGWILELGSGTGLVGIAAACLWNLNVVLSDLPEIVPNLRRNVDSNVKLTENCGVTLEVQALDWSDDTCKPSCEQDRYAMIVAADPIYNADHPRILVDTVQRWLKRSTHSRFILEMPLREGYDKERCDLRTRLNEACMDLLEEGTETGFDDWEGVDGRPSEVECWWSVWRPRQGAT